VYGDDHHFTQCARQNLEYVLNKRRSVYRHEQERKQRKAAELQRASQAVREAQKEAEKEGVKEGAREGVKEVGREVGREVVDTAGTAASAVGALGTAFGSTVGTVGSTVDTVGTAVGSTASSAVLPAGASTGAEPLQGLSPASKPPAAGGNSGPAATVGGATSGVSEAATAYE
jgi:hypothetical protein